MIASGYNVLASPLPGFDKDRFWEWDAKKNAVPAKLASEAQGETVAGIQRKPASKPAP